MWTADWIAIVYFAYLAVAGWLVPGVRPRRRIAVSAIALVFIALIRVAAGLAHVALAHAVLELVWLLLGYWLPAALWRGPMPRAEAWLRASDRWLDRRLARGTAHFTRIHRWGSSILEAAYLLVHLVVPAAWLVVVHFTPGSVPDRFWTCILLAGYACYGTLPWIQTRPPRALPDRGDTPLAPAAAPEHTVLSPLASGGRLRRLNLRILDSLSVEVNTFPSGHSAVAITAALCVYWTNPLAGAIFLILAALIAVATVILRYHYTADTVLGLVIGLTIWLLVW